MVGEKAASSAHLRWISAAFWITLLLACQGPGEVVSPRDEASIQEALEIYLPLMARAYGDGNLESLQGLAAEKEIAGLYKRIQDLWLEGRVLDASLKGVTVEDVQIWNYANAFVTTFEIWDLQIYHAGSDSLLSQALNQRNRVKYQLKRQGEGWLVLHREIDTTFE